MHTYRRVFQHLSSFHSPLGLKCRQSSPPHASLGSFVPQFSYDSGALDEFHTHVPSDAASVPPIHTSLPSAAVTSSAFSAADRTLASCLPAARQAAAASPHERVPLMRV